jgi:cardiolipin synthase
LSALAYAGILKPQSFHTESDGVELLWSDQYVKRVLELIDSAEKRVWVAMYVCRYKPELNHSIENKVLKALIKAHRQGVDVRVVVDEGFEWDSKRARVSKQRSKKNDAASAHLHKHGIEVRRDDPQRIMHGKFLLVDDDFAVIGSHNWTYSALKRNIEASVLLRGQDDIAELSQHYRQLWQKSSPL